MTQAQRLIGRSKNTGPLSFIGHTNKTTAREPLRPGRSTPRNTPTIGFRSPGSFRVQTDLSDIPVPAGVQGPITIVPGPHYKMRDKIKTKYHDKET